MISRYLKHTPKANICDGLNQINDFDFQFRKILNRYNLIEYESDLRIFAGYFQKVIDHFFTKWNKVEELFSNYESYSSEYNNLKNVLTKNSIEKIKIFPNGTDCAIELTNKPLINLIEQTLSLITKKPVDEFKTIWFYKKPESHLKQCTGIFSTLFDYVYEKTGKKNYHFIVELTTFLGFEYKYVTTNDPTAYLKDRFKERNRKPVIFMVFP